MRGEKRVALLLAFTLLLSCLTGCSNTGREASDSAAAYGGTWYLAKNGVSCQFVDENIYQYDPRAEDSLSLIGIYSWSDDHIDAYIVGTGGLQDPKALYIASDDEDGEFLCTAADGTGTVYFYREPLAALRALEAIEAERSMPLPSATQGVGSEPSILPLPSPGAEEEDLPSLRALPQTEPEAETTAPAAEPPGNSTSVWVSKTGSKYHRDPNCSGMKNPSQLTKFQAESRGLTPCKRCY